MCYPYENENVMSRLQQTHSGQVALTGVHTCDVIEV